MELAALLAFAGVAAALIVVPGPDWALVVAAGSRQGLVAPAVTGLAVGYVLITAGVVSGLAPLVAAAPSALLVLTVGGGAYLLYVGVDMLRRPASTQPLDEGLGIAGGALRTLRQGVGVSALNPKALLFFLAFLPQFARPDAPWPFAVQLAVLGATWIVLAAGFYSVLGLTVRRALTRRPTLTQSLTRVAGAAMVVAGLALPVEHLVRH